MMMMMMMVRTFERNVLGMAVQLYPFQVTFVGQKSPIKVQDSKWKISFYRLKVKVELEKSVRPHCEITRQNQLKSSYGFNSTANN